MCTLFVSKAYLRSYLSVSLNFAHNISRGYGCVFWGSCTLDLLLVQYYDLIRCFDILFQSISEELPVQLSSHFARDTSRICLLW